MKRTEERTDCEIENMLRTLPDVQPSRNFQERLGKMLAKRHMDQTKERRSKKNFKGILRFGVAAAGLLIVLFAAFTFFPGEERLGYSPGPLSLATAHANAAGASGITLGSGLDSMRQVKFNVLGVLPAGEREGTIVRLKNERKTEKDVLEMAGALGIQNPEVSDDYRDEPETSYIGVSGRKGRLSVWLNQGTWLYEQETGSSMESSQRVSPEAAKDIAIQWLRDAGLLPQGEYIINQTPASETPFTTVIKPAQGPEGRAIMGAVPEIRVSVTEQGQVAHAIATWYEKEEDGAEKVYLSDYVQALEALKRGEGVFNAASYRPFTAGTAEIQEVETAYQLAYALDFTPYYVPVAVFHGVFIPEGGTEETFTAYVPLLEHKQQKNAGNFTLDTALPQVDTASSAIAERGNEATRDELPMLARFFGVIGQPDADGGISGEKGEISPTSWDGGWLYRSPLIGKDRSSTPASDEVAMASADRIVADIPKLPGELGQPFIMYHDGDDFKYVVYPLLYEGKFVFNTDSGPGGYESNISVQVGPRGEIWSVYCAKPMTLLQDKQPLIRPEKAWEKLLKNDSLIHVQGFFGFIPGDRFTAAYSKVTGAELVYKPRYTNIARNENYDIVYMFTGTARIGTKEVRFTAFVDAVEDK